MAGKPQIPQAVDVEVIIPLKPPYAQLPKPKNDTVLVCELGIKFPKQCAWCGNESGIATRPVQLYVDNQMYRPRGQRLLREAGGLAAGLALGGAGGMGTVAYGLLKPSDLQKIKGFVFRVQVPHCANHAKAALDGAIEWGGLEGNLSTFKIRVRDAEYARAIARVNDPTMRVPALAGLIWPERCVVCGASDASERYKAKVKGSTASQDESVDVPICANDLKRFRRSGEAFTIIVLTGVLAAIGVGGLTLTMKADSSGHLVLFACGGILGGLVWAGALMTIAARLLGVRSVGTPPVSITLKDNQYLLEFYNSEMADTVRQVNGLNENG